MKMKMKINKKKNNSMSISNVSQSTQIELKARCKLPSVNFIGKVWYYKHYDADFFKAPSSETDYIGLKLTSATIKDVDENPITIECHHIKNQTVETWTTTFSSINELVNDFSKNVTKNVDTGKLCKLMNRLIS